MLCCARASLVPPQPCTAHQRLAPDQHPPPTTARTCRPCCLAVPTARRYTSTTAPTASGSLRQAGLSATSRSVGPAAASAAAAGCAPSSPRSSPAGARCRTAAASKRRLSASARRAATSGAAAAPPLVAAAACWMNGEVRAAAASCSCWPGRPAATRARPSTTSCRSAMGRAAPAAASAPCASPCSQPKAPASRSLQEQRRHSCWKACAAVWLACVQEAVWVAAGSHQAGLWDLAKGWQ